MLKKRTVVTSLSIAAIVLAGGAAVAANVGILSAADDTPIGTLSAQADMAGVAPTSPPSTSTATSANFRKEASATPAPSRRLEASK